MHWFPDDENGDALRRLVEKGDRLVEARDIDFDHVFETRHVAEQFLAAVKPLGYAQATCGYWEKQRAWCASVSVLMAPDHAMITRTEARLAAVAEEFMGRAHGWGCFAVIRRESESA